MDKAFLILHAALFVALIGVATHNAVFSARALRGKVVGLAVHRLWTAVLAVVYVSAMSVGLWIYPAFRVDVRADYLDQAVPLATGFFEVKEHWIGLGLAALIWYVAVSRRFDPKTPEPWHIVYHLTGLTLAAGVWIAGAVGFTLVALKPL